MDVICWPIWQSLNKGHPLVCVCVCFHQYECGPGARGPRTQSLLKFPFAANKRPVQPGSRHTALLEYRRPLSFLGDCSLGLHGVCICSQGSHQSRFQAQRVWMSPTGPQKVTNCSTLPPCQPHVKIKNVIQLLYITVICHLNVFFSLVLCPKSKIFIKK